MNNSHNLFKLLEYAYNIVFVGMVCHQMTANNFGVLLSEIIAHIVSSA